jgi:translation initiation factor 1
VDLPAKGQTAYVKRERKGRAGKTVTVVYGLAHSPATLQELLKTLKTLCGAGGTLREDTLEIQGDHRERIAEKLTAMGYRVKLAGG